MGTGEELQDYQRAGWEKQVLWVLLVHIALFQGGGIDCGGISHLTVWREDSVDTPPVASCTLSHPKPQVPFLLQGR